MRLRKAKGKKQEASDMKKNKRSVAPNEPTSGTGEASAGGQVAGGGGDGTESEAFIYDLISCTFDITIAVNASSF